MSSNRGRIPLLSSWLTNLVLPSVCLDASGDAAGENDLALLVVRRHAPGGAAGENDPVLHGVRLVVLVPSPGSGVVLLRPVPSERERGRRRLGPQQAPIDGP